MYKLVTVDLDGTLLNQYGEVTDHTKQVLKKVMAKGIDVVIASGRPISSIKVIADEIESKNYFIAGNGSTIYDIKNDKKIYEKFIPKEKALEVIDICEQNSIHYNIYTDNEIIAKSLQYNVLYYYKENQKRAEEKKEKINIVDSIKEYVQNIKDKEILKMTVCDKDKAVFNSIIRRLKSVQGINVLDVSHMSRKIIRQGTEDIPIEYFYTEISTEEVNKWVAIKHLIDKLNINPEEVIAVGDNMNDIEMLENAGMGIAMRQSTPKVLEIANYITDENFNDGVANALEKILNL